MTTSEHIYSLLSNLPIKISNSNPTLYYWRGVMLVEPLVLAIISSVIFRVPISPEIRKVAGQAQLQAVHNQDIADSAFLKDHHNVTNIEEACYYHYYSAVRNQFQEPNMFEKYSIREVLDWVKPQESL